MAATEFYQQLPGPHGRQESVDGYWDENEITDQTGGVPRSATAPVVPAYFFGPDYATGDRVPSETPVVDL